MRLFRRISVDYIIIAIVMIVICVRLVSFGYLSSLAASNPTAHPYPVVAGDSIHYAQLGSNLLSFHAYQWDAGMPYRGAPPGYPALLAGTLAITGSMTPLVGIQILFAICATILLYKMSRTLLSVPYAVAVTLVYALDPMTIFADTTLITDGFFSSFLICIVYFAFFWVSKREYVRWGLVGVFLGIATMIRPIAQFLILVFPAMYLLREWMSGMREDRSRIWAMCACVIGFVLVVSPWIARNHTYFGSFEISYLGSDNLLKNDARGFLAWRALSQTDHPLPAILVMRHINDPIFQVLDKQIKTDLAQMTPPGGNPDNYEGRLAMRYILHDPIRYAYFHTVNTIPFFISSSVATYGQTIRQLRTSEGFFAPTSLSLLNTVQHILHPESLGAFIKAIYSIAPIALEILWWVLVSLAALIATILFRKNFVILLCATLILYFAALTGPMSASRYRIPAEPYLLILAAMGTHVVVQRIKEKLSRSV